MLAILKKINVFLDKLAVFSLYLLLIYLPFYELILHFLESKTSLSVGVIFWLTHFYEPLLVILLLYYLVKLIVNKSIKPLYCFDMFLVAFIFLSVVLVAISGAGMSRGLEGLRFLILPFGIYLLARLTNYQNPKTLVTIYLIIAVFFAAIGIFEYFFLPPGYWAGYLGISNFGYGQNSIIATSQATALLAGPNQLASYLILAFFYLLHHFFPSNKPAYLDVKNYLFLLVALAIGLTYSRSALIGLLIATIWMFVSFRRQFRSKIIQTILFLVVAITTVVSYAMYNGEFLSDIVTHGSSFSQHFQATKDGLVKLANSSIVALFFGRGIGSAGPTALKIGGIIPENYYLQVFFETGLVGFGLLTAFFSAILRTLYKGSKTLFFAFVALLINALFLHIFSDNPSMSATIFILIALVVNVEEGKKLKISPITEV